MVHAAQRLLADGVPEHFPDPENGSGAIRAAYLFTETDAGDTTYFILHQLETIRKAIAGLHDYLAMKSRDQQSLERLLASAPLLRSRLNHRQRSLLAHALKHPGTSYRIDAHQRSHGISYQTARTDLMGLADLGLLNTVKEGKAFLFYASPELERHLRSMAETQANPPL